MSIDDRCTLLDPVAILQPDRPVVFSSWPVGSPMVDIVGVGDEWDGCSQMRDVVRESGIMMVRPMGNQWCEPNRTNCINNQAALVPLLHRMRDEGEPFKLPILEDLKKEVGVLFHRMTVQVKEKEVYTTAVELKKLLSFIKRKAHRMECTKERYIQTTCYKITLQYIQVRNEVQLSCFGFECIRLISVQVPKSCRWASNFPWGSEVSWPHFGTEPGFEGSGLENWWL